MGGWTGIGKDKIYWNGTIKADAFEPAGSGGGAASAALWNRNVASGAIYPVALTDNVGIGTDNPKTALNLEGQFQINRIGSTSQYLNFLSNSTGHKLNALGNKGFTISSDNSVSHSADIAVTFSSGTGNIRFRTNNTQTKMTISNNGNIGIGMVASSAMLQVAGVASCAVVIAGSENVNNHIASTAIHYAQSAIDHTNLTNIGTNTHAQIDDFIAAGGGISSHSLLSQLDYATAGHTGFCSSAIFDTHAASAAIHFTSEAMTAHISSSAIHLGASAAALDHGTASSAMLINFLYGTSGALAPSAALTTEGAVYLVYTA